MNKKSEPGFNSRKYQGQLERELIIGAILILVVVGGGLIAFFWGGTAFITALGCFALALGLIVLLWFFFKVLEWVVRD